MSLQRLARLLLAVSVALGALSACGGGGGGASAVGANLAPRANAGPAQTARVAALVSLNGGASTDPEGAALRYRWTLSARPAGSAAVLSSTTTVDTGFTPDVVGVYTATLIVNDGVQDSLPSTVTITAGYNVAPVANAGAAQSVAVGAVVTLDGTASTDANGDRLTYSWTLLSRPAGSNAALALPDTAKPTFTADVAGTYTATLTVNDGLLGSQQASVTITATVSPPPVAVVGPTQGTTAGSSVTVGGNTNATLSYRWTLIAKPPGSNVTLGPLNTPTLSFVPDLPGIYVAQVVVSDGVLSSAPALVTVTVGQSNAPPVANAGADQAVSRGATVTLDGRKSSDANGDPLSYKWTLTSLPTGSTAVLSSTTVAQPTFVADKPGIYVAQLVVSDGQADSLIARTTITVIGP